MDITTPARTKMSAFTHVRYASLHDSSDDSDLDEETVGLKLAEKLARGWFSRRRTQLECLGRCLPLHQILREWLALFFGFVFTCLYALVPSFLRKTDKAPSRRLHSTAWLDGLRGIAAFLVIVHHTSLLFFSWEIHHGWGSVPKEPRFFIQLPIIRIIVSGRAQVWIFYAVSGYALSHKPLRLARAGRSAELLDTLASAFARRHTRLFLPVAAISFASALAAQAGVFGVLADARPGVGVPLRVPPAFPKHLDDRFLHWLKSFIDLANPLDRNLMRGVNYAYDPNMWTLPVEFDCSVIVFGILLAFSRFRPLVRMTFVLGLVVFCSWRIYTEVFLFIGGVLLAEVGMHFPVSKSAVEATTPPERAETLSACMPPTQQFNPANTAIELQSVTPPRTPPQQSSSELPRWTSVPLPSADTKPEAAPKRSIWYIILSSIPFLMALYVLSMPEPDNFGSATPGFRTLARLVPAAYVTHEAAFWLPIAAVAVVLTADRAGPQGLPQRFCASRPAQFLGRVSYSLYLIHGPLLWSFGRWLGQKTVPIVGGNGNKAVGRYCLGVALAFALYLPVLFWLADLGTMYLDRGSVALGRKVYAWLKA